MQFWHIRCLKSAPKLTCFVHFYFKMCFSPQVHAFFRHLNSKKCSRTTIFLKHFHFQMCVSPQRRSFFRHLNSKKCSQTTSFLTFSLPNLRFATAACIFSTSQLQKVLPDHFFNIFTSKFAFRHSGVQFFDIRTSKRAPTPSVFVHFDLEMCFSPQRRAIFDFSSEHLPPHPPL